MSLRISLLFLMASIQVACCSQALSYPVITDVSKIEVTKGSNTHVKETVDGSQISKIVRFIDERRGRWCSPRFGSLPQASATLNLYLENNGKGVIGFGNGFFVSEFSGGKYKMDISDAEEQEFLQLLGISQEDVFSK